MTDRNWNYGIEVDSVNGDRVAAPGAQGKWSKASVVERGKFLRCYLVGEFML